MFARTKRTLTNNQTEFFAGVIYRFNFDSPPASASTTQKVYFYMIKYSRILYLYWLAQVCYFLRAMIAPTRSEMRGALIGFAVIAVYEIMEVMQSANPGHVDIGSISDGGYPGLAGLAEIVTFGMGGLDSAHAFDNKTITAWVCEAVGLGYDMSKH